MTSKGNGENKKITMVVIECDDTCGGALGALPAPPSRLQNLKDYVLLTTVFVILPLAIITAVLLYIWTKM